ncbi:MAG TPA: PA domain-containing protein [Thermoanaerobaculia bacterium]|nr:PA domain-containing protein [Thermoanaerobaculia bacterium]
MRQVRILASLAFCLALASSAFATAKITIRNTDQAGVGFNDTTAAAPVGGNAGTTLGQQRLNAFRAAADVWGDTIDSKVEIIIDASFAPLSCTATSATLGSAGPTRIFSDFENAPKANTWYVSALANKIAGVDLHDDGAAHIRARFNGDLDKPSCLGTVSWYYGLDGNHGEDVDLVVVLLHEFAHGLGMVGSVVVPGNSSDTATPGSLRYQGIPMVYDTLALDNSTGLRLDQESDEQRATALVNDQNLVWAGQLSTTAAGKYLRAQALLTIAGSTPVSKTFAAGFAFFGPEAPLAGLTGRIAAATDAAEPASGSTSSGSTTDGCSAFNNASSIAGRIALVDRGRCNYSQKARNAQDAGAIAVLVVDNGFDSIPPNMSGSDSSLTIPTISVTKQNGDAIRAALSLNLDATLRSDPTKRNGADTTGSVKLYAPGDPSPGSTYSHWDVTAVPNLLMEPRINDDLSHGLDITNDQLNDIGWNTGSSTSPVQPPPEPTNGGFNGRRILKRKP